MNLIHLRERLHQIPELAFGEAKTKALLLGTLNELIPQSDPAWKIEEFKNSNGILISYTCDNLPYRLFRADMDALPIAEVTACNYSSQHQGFMHACGHDVHMTVLMGLIEAIVKYQPQRNLLFLFQPAEEGQGGAQAILAEGLIQSYNIDSAIALHVASELPVGTISSKSGVFFGIPQEFDVRFSGKAAHVAFPEKGANALEAGVDFMQSIREQLKPLQEHHRLIFHVGKMTSGTIRNVIADDCLLEGTHRTLNPEIRDCINNLIHSTANTTAARHRATARVDLLCSYDAVVNSDKLVNELVDVCSTQGLSYKTAETAMTGEDFGFFTTLYPGLLFWLGSGCNYPLHSEKFLPDPACIETGVKVMLGLALDGTLIT